MVLGGLIGNDYIRAGQTVPHKPVGEATVKITINTDEILRDLEKIRKADKKARDLEIADGINLAAFLTRNGWVKE